MAERKIIPASFRTWEAACAWAVLVTTNPANARIELPQDRAWGRSAYAPTKVRVWKGAAGRWLVAPRRPVR